MRASLKSDETLVQQQGKKFRNEVAGLALHRSTHTRCEVILRDMCKIQQAMAMIRCKTKRSRAEQIQ